MWTPAQGEEKNSYLKFLFIEGKPVDKSQICDDIHVRIMTTRGQRGSFCVVGMILLLQCAMFASILTPYKFIEIDNLCIFLYLHCISLKFDGCALHFL